MSRKFALPSGMLAFAPEKDEETIIVHWLEAIRQKIPPTESWLGALDMHFYEKGHPLAADHLEYLNIHLRRGGNQPITLRETSPVDKYIRERNYEDHAINRRAIRDYLLSVTPDDRTQIVADAVKRAAALEPAHKTWEEIVTERQPCERPVPVQPMETTISGIHRSVEDVGLSKPTDDMTVLLRTLAMIESPAIKERLVKFIVEHYC